MQKDIVEQNKEIITVGELNRSAKYLLEDAFTNIAVIGEISNISRPSSGHIYFTLKDEDGAIGCAMWRSQATKLNFKPEDGDKCILKGQVSLYPATGRYQLMVKSIEQAGSGNLMHQFEQLKKKLDSEGLFDLSKKLSLPKSPKHIGVITSASTAAFQDILSTIKRRAPSSRISLSPAVVQGDAAAGSLIKALDRIIKFNENNPENSIDVAIIARGGGSIEDLWCFNNEDLARQIALFPIPTISGVGHEIDFTICDFVSDMRAPTPTASAEIVTEFSFQVFDKLSEIQNNLHRFIRISLKDKLQKIQFLKGNIKNPLLILREQSQKIDNYELKLKQNMKLNYSNNKQRFNLAVSKFREKSPAALIQENYSKINNIKELIKRAIKLKVSKSISALKEFEKNLDILNPLSILERGYSIIQNKSGSSIKSISEVESGDILTARLNKGFLDIEVKNIKDA
ncbi:exodeoxyribonuclease VII large subunit [Gammaproteobacteria bacterium]|nr:exodeoxyribonuclease VII large subunit [Gammaproteobacteria bacterium]MDA9805206.1 exodeoxyribonuclease VII large subunit [Gammaproteobacteria bacterium]MDC3268089.1 exodeoxyribonuclease VII large subunit [Gammaproteobacteria bacterium]